VHKVRCYACSCPGEPSSPSRCTPLLCNRLHEFDLVRQWWPDVDLSSNRALMMSPPVVGVGCPRW
jgi:hypothetical protein